KRLARLVTLQSVGEQLNVEAVETLVAPEAVLDLQRVAGGLALDESVLDYAVRLVRATRTWNGVSAGAGPRGYIALIRAARAAALASWWRPAALAVALTAAADGWIAWKTVPLAADRATPPSLALGVWRRVTLRVWNRASAPRTAELFDHHPPECEVRGMPHAI